MPHEVIIAQNQLTHTGYFDGPVLGLWGEGKVILGGLYQAFAPYGASVANIRVESASPSPSDQVMAVTLGLNKIHRFRLDRVESTMSNFSEEDLGSFPELLAASSLWIRSAVPGFRFRAHQFTYAAHGRLKGDAAEEFLQGLGIKAPTTGGRDCGTGAVFHWRVPETGWETQVVLDHSIVLAGGLFVMFLLAVKTDEVDYAKLVQEGRAYFEGILGDLGLSLSRGG